MDQGKWVAMGCNILTMIVQFKVVHNIFAHLQELSEFGWDEGRKVVVASEEMWAGTVTQRPRLHSVSLYIAGSTRTLSPT